MKRSIFSRAVETGALICTWPISILWAICYIVIAASLDVANRVAGIWGKS